MGLYMARPVQPYSHFKQGGDTVALWHRCRCGGLIPQGIKVCPKCAAGENSGQSRHMEYNRFRRDKKAADFYVSNEWRTARDAALRLYDGIDIYAFYIQKRVVAADMVHHIEELSENWSRRCDLTNLLPLSNGNHGIVSAAYDKGEDEKKAMQEELLQLIAEHWKDSGGLEKVLSGVI